MSNTKQNPNVNADAGELDLEALEQVVGGITPIPIPGSSLVLPVSLTSMVSADLSKSLATFVQTTGTTGG